MERCFDLARSIDLHQASTAETRERAISGRTSGLIGLGEEVTWQARHFGVWQILTSRITAYNPPHHFRDTQVRGVFRRFDHDHYFLREGTGTQMVDVFDFQAPFGVLGILAERSFLMRYMQRFLTARNAVIKCVAESQRWQQFLST